ncbi:amino acid adenylation domain-containing protein [Hazenella sp. IB182353]|uniref:amino acid adenylation domain-containing protein n=1 Tax=Polycladospora coralii TaxID=2771432 RepID=UPI001746A6A3|nr:non-ribosomal peptide synthetase [Polycladospora coralii]MBS7529946.1 amino acid adenylation domain-containing protein [Polycladospora coralii]
MSQTEHHRRALTGAQSGIWYAQKLDPHNPVYNTGEYVEIKGFIHEQHFVDSIQQVVMNADALHMKYGEDEEGPWQQIQTEKKFHFSYRDLSEEPNACKEAMDQMRKDLQKPIDLFSQPLYNQILFKINEDHFLWFQKMHHIALDGFGFTLLAQAVAKVYSATISGRTYTEPLFGSYQDVLEEDFQYRASTKLSEDRLFWKKQYADQPEVVSLTNHTLKLPRQTITVSGLLAHADQENLRKLASDCKASWHEILIASMAIYIHRLTGSKDVILSLPMMGRLGSSALKVPAMVMNLLPLRLRIGTSMSMRELIKHIQMEMRTIRKYQRYRHEEMRRDLHLLGDNKRLFGPQINIMPFEYSLDFAGVKGTTHKLATGPVEDLSFNIYDQQSGSGLRIDLDANADMYEEESIRLHLQRFIHMVTSMTRVNTDVSVGKVNLLLPEEKKWVIEDFNQPLMSLPEQDLVQMFEAQVYADGKAEALICNDVTLSYNELNLQVNRLAGLLTDHQIGPGQFVAIALPRSVDMVVAMLAVLKTGAGYLPIDPTYPTDRIAYMLQDTKPVCVITNKDTHTELPHYEGNHFILDEVEFINKLTQSDKKTFVPAHLISPSHPAYVIYTSGSTGKPKGIMINRGSLINFLEDMRLKFHLDQRDRFLAVTTICFDISILEIFLPLLSGATCEIAQREIVQTPALLAKQIVNRKITIMQATPTLWKTLVADYPSALHHLKVLVGGEALPHALAQALRELNCEVTNLYGPTETTIWSSAYHLSEYPDDPPPIGKPILNTQMYVLDHALNPLPPGVAGDLYIAGKGLADGYLGRPDLTAERFVANPFGPLGTRMYRTGDIARWSKNGTLEYINRADHQVKIRGYRIEPAEIEAAIAKYNTVHQVVIMVREDTAGDKRIDAYIVPVSKSELDVNGLRQFLGYSLPDYMIPSTFVELEAMPLTPNGKLNRKELPVPYIQTHDRGREPRTPQEEILCDLFGEVLDIKRVSIDDRFFDLGGHSLLAGKLMNRIREIFGVELGIGTLFASPTVSELVKQLSRGKPLRPPIVKVEKPSKIPLSFAQNRLWFLHQMEGPSPTYNIPVVMELKGKLDRDILDDALFDLVKRHEVLRTIFPEQNGVAQQMILDPMDAKPQIHVTSCTEESLQSDKKAAVGYAFDLAKEPSFRVELLERSTDHHVLILLLHHIIGDGWSLHPLIKDLEYAYKKRYQGQAPDFEKLSVQYSDYAIWQNQLLGNEEDQNSLISSQMDYWKHTLEHIPDDLEWKRDYPRPAESTYRGETLTFQVKPVLHRCLIELARENGVSLFMVLQAGLTALMTRLGAGSDIPLGSPIAGRNDDHINDLVGLFVNTLVLRTDTSGNPSFRDLMGRVRKVNIAAYENQDLPFERIVEVLNPPRSRAKHPLFQIMLALQNTPDLELDLPEIDTDISISHTGTAKFDLTLEFRETTDEDGMPNGLDAFLEYSTDLFEKSSMDEFAERLIRFLTAVSENQDQPIGQVKILGDSEYQALVPIVQDYEKVDHTLISLFEEQVNIHQNEIALFFENEKISYTDINTRANQVAHRLIQMGIGPEQFVALAVPRSIEMVVGLLGILKAGAAYVPLDPAYPVDRLAFMIADAKPTCLLTMTETKTSLPDIKDIPVVDLRVVQQEQFLLLHNPNNQDRVQPLMSAHPAYVIYTSGSTGVPKGVVVPHQNVMRLFEATKNWYQFKSDDVWTLFHSYAFDFSVWELWGALLYGGRLVVVPHDVSRSPRDLLALLVKEKVTVLNQTPSAFYQLIQADRENTEIGQFLQLRYVIFGGEALETSRLKDWYDRHPVNQPKCINMYGITETTVHVSYLELNSPIDDMNGNSLIGSRIPDLGVYVLDEWLQPVPIGVKGEMYISGNGLARGYLNRLGLTAERFIANPFGPPGSRMYRTGDLARWQSIGKLDYLGRADQQIKVRGFRIELGEIEAVMNDFSEIDQVAVVVREDQPGNQRLVAYFVGSSTSECDRGQLRQYLSSRLPEYMVPSSFVQIGSLPLTPNGKLDQKALPAPDFAAEVSESLPRTPQEEMLCHLFMEVLNLPRIGIEDSFFELGGHSLLAVQLMTRIRDEMGIDLNIGTLFTSPTVAGLAEKLEMGNNQSSLEVLLPLREKGERSPLFCVHPAGGLSWCYAGLMSSLGREYPIYGLQARGIARKSDLPQSINQMAEEYIRQIKTVQPEGPYYLLGWSLGGNVIHAMATHLQALGDEVALVAMLDAYPSHFLPIKNTPDDEEALIALLALGGYDSEELGNQPLDLQGALDILRKDGSALASLKDENILNLRETYVNSVGILSRYSPTVYNGNLLFFRSTIIPEWFDPISPDSWKSYVNGEIEQYDIVCRHKDMCQPEPLAEIGSILEEKLRKLTSNFTVSQV